MKRVLAICLLALVLVPAVQAHSYLNTNSTTRSYQSGMERRINDYRLRHGRFLVIDSLTLHVAGTALSWANYREAKYTTRIEGVPWQIWNDGFLTPSQQLANDMILSARCHGRSWTPRQALRSLIYDADPTIRAALLFTGFHTIGVRTVYHHQHRGWFRGKGRCTIFYIAMAS